MKALKRSLRIAAVLVSLLVSLHNSPAPIFMHYEGVDGESTAPGHERDIDLISFTQSHSRSNNVPAPTLSECTITKAVDASSPKLAEACAKGQPTPKVEIFVRKASGTNDYYKIVLKEVVISGYQVGGGGGSSGESLPTESISMNYAEIEWTYQKQDAAGQPVGPPIVGSWPPSSVP